MNIARLFSAYRLLEKQASRDRVRHRAELSRMRAELFEWQNTVRQLKGITPLFTVPKPPEPREMPPVGPTQKKLALAQRQGENPVPTAEQILGAAAAANGNR